MGFCQSIKNMEEMVYFKAQSNNNSSSNNNKMRIKLCHTLSKYDTSKVFPLKLNTFSCSIRGTSIGSDELMDLILYYISTHATTKYKVETLSIQNGY